jgi:hypothetical protein
MLQNKFLKISLKVPWLIRNHHVHNDTGIPVINTGIKILFKSFLTKLKESYGARRYQLGSKTRNRRLLRRLHQGILITDTEKLSLGDYYNYNYINVK